MPQFPAVQGFDVSEGLLARAAQSAAMPDRKQSPMQGFLAAKAAKKEEELQQAQFAEQQRQFGVTSDRADKQFNLTKKQLENTIANQKRVAEQAAEELAYNQEQDAFNNYMENKKLDLEYKKLNGLGDDWSKYASTADPDLYTGESFNAFKASGGNDYSLLIPRKGPAAKRAEAAIDSGLRAAKGLAGVKRTLELLKKVNTSGVTEQLVLAKQFFGIEEPEEGELKNLLAEAVLGRLKETFGAAFTAGEGDRLADISAGLGKSNKSNEAILNNMLQVMEQQIEDAKIAAEAENDTATLSRIYQWQNMKLGENSGSPTTSAADPTNTQKGDPVGAVHNYGGVEFEVIQE